MIQVIFASCVVCIGHNNLKFLFLQAKITTDTATDLLITRVRLEEEMAGLDTHSLPSCSSCSHTTEGQYRTCTDIFLVNNGYILDFLSTIYVLFCYFYEPNGV